MGVRLYYGITVHFIRFNCSIKVAGKCSCFSEMGIKCYDEYQFIIKVLYLPKWAGKGGEMLT